MLCQAVTGLSGTVCLIHFWRPSCHEAGLPSPHALRPLPSPQCEALLAPHAAGCSRQTAQPGTPRHPMHKGFFFFCFTHRSPSPNLCSTSAAYAQRQPGARRRSHGGLWSFLVKELIQVSSDSIFPPLLDKQNREMPLTRKRSSNHLVFASRSLPVTVETTPLPPTCCQCLDCSYSLLIKLASPLLFCYPIQSHYVLQTPCRSD